jgi:predicted N-acetyltransferase YhbS
MTKELMVVEDVIADKDHGRKGIGSKLMSELERHAVNHGCAYIVFVTEKNRWARINFTSHSDAVLTRTRDLRNDLKRGNNILEHIGSYVSNDQCGR